MGATQGGTTATRQPGAIDFGIDGDDFTDGERRAFVLGFEFARVAIKARAGLALDEVIHAANEQRIAMMVYRLGRPYQTNRLDDRWFELKAPGVTGDAEDAG